jgi:hypothetical protein
MHFSAFLESQENETRQEMSAGRYTFWSVSFVIIPNAKFVNTFLSILTHTHYKIYLHLSNRFTMDLHRYIVTGEIYNRYPLKTSIYLSLQSIMYDAQLFFYVGHFVYQ